MEKNINSLLTRLVFIVIYCSPIDGTDLNNLDIYEKQKFIFQLLEYVTEPVHYENIKNVSMFFDIQKQVDKYNKIEDVKWFLKIRREKSLSRGELFCIFNIYHAQEAVASFNVLHGAKDFSTFLTTACWMRRNINELVFVYSFSLAVRHRKDCVGLVLPPIYEIYPFTFVAAATQESISRYFMTSNNAETVVFKATLPVNDGSENVNLKYFTEDIGLNTFYYNFHLDYPFWMTDEVYGLNIDRRGELYIHLHRQLLARYNLERQSNQLCSVPSFNPTQVVERVFDSPLMFHNGFTMPSRFMDLDMLKYKYELVKDLEFLEYQIRETVFREHFVNCDGNKIDFQQKEAIEALGRRIYGNLRQSNDKLEHDLEYTTRALLSFSMKISQRSEIPTAGIQYYEATLRDPIFWELQTYLMVLLEKVIQKKPIYRREHLYNYGVDITNVSVTPLLTYFDENVFDISHIYKVPNRPTGTESENVNIFYKKKQLNSVPFNISITIHSAKSEQSVLRIFLGPSSDCESNMIGFDENFRNYIEIDSVMFNLKPGNNTIERQSENFSTLFRSQNISKLGLNEAISYKFNGNQYQNSFTGFPANLILPKGLKFGLRLQLFVMVSPLYQKFTVENSVDQFKRKRVCRYTLCLDDRSLGFPFDRYWDNVSGNLYPNMKLTNVFVFHKNNI
ncbi:basic juvenile hormone-suppressible protein 2 [Plutella xylostella]|uniref:basic juvenile hormone-suppressible protein 2 n=1 Tax=Plutella xylostella TaxID=51655 RepID=UPI00203314D5|nr:basic juvenile hormone-suppressible protein 2 [Plutella xylostella]